MVNPESFDPMPSWRRRSTVEVVPWADGHVAAGPSPAPTMVGLPVAVGGAVPEAVGQSWDSLTAAGFDGRVGQVLVCPAPGAPSVVAYGIGDPSRVDAAAMRDAAAAVALAGRRHGRLALTLPTGTDASVGVLAQSAVEGALLARYAYTALKESPDEPLAALTLRVPPDSLSAAERGAERGEVYARATALARDLANAPPSLLTAVRIAECASELGPQAGLEVEIFDQDALQALGCGGLLGVNAGSADPPRMIRLRYRPAEHNSRQVAHVTLVGKGIMYDSGGISLKPSDAVHATMKNDMSGAGAILAAMATLGELACPVAVTGYLMCTDNMPSGTATKLGDVLSIRGGTTVEVINTDAEGRLVMADALVLATEEPTDAIIDIATLTGASLRALGPDIAGVFSNNDLLADQVLAAGRAVDEPGWRLPLAHRYRPELDSDVADLKNMGGPNGAAIHAALFLEEFVGGRPWAHIDIAGPAQNDTAAAWQPRGCSGFGARLLVELVGRYDAVKAS